MSWNVYEVANTEEEQPIAWECSECGEVVSAKCNFCPTCGVDTRKEKSMNFVGGVCENVQTPTKSEEPPISAIMGNIDGYLSECLAMLDRMTMSVYGRGLESAPMEDAKCMRDAANITAGKAKTVHMGIRMLMEAIGV